jgi:hypothetical protein
MDYHPLWLTKANNSSRWKIFSPCANYSPQENLYCHDFAGRHPAYRMEDSRFSWKAIKAVRPTVVEFDFLATQRLPLPFPVPVSLPFPVPVPLPFPVPVPLPFPVPVSLPVPVPVPLPVPAPVSLPVPAPVPAAVPAPA